MPRPQSSATRETAGRGSLVSATGVNPESGAAEARADRDRLFPADPTTRSVARDLYDSVARAPILSPHGHVPVAWLAEDRQFADPTELLVTHDHYVTRLLHASGVALSELGVGGNVVAPRSAWRLFAEHWDKFAGTASGYWIREELIEVLGVTSDLSPTTADSIFDEIELKLELPEFRPRALFERFGIEVLATTDDPLDGLEHHAAIARSSLPGRVLPTFRPDRYLDPDQEGFRTCVPELLGATGSPATFAGYLDALRQRREYFIRHGAVSTDHGVEEPYTVDLSDHDAEQLFQRVLSGTADESQRRMFRGHMLLRMAELSVEDGLVMTVHAGVVRNHSSVTHRRFGADSGHDIPRQTDFVRGLRPLLERFGLERSLHLVLFAVDEAVYSRELAPMAGFYPSVYVGAPWWFLDAPDAMQRFRAAVTETAGFSRGSGFVDDTRAFLSIPARHDTARRADAAYLARLVVEERIAMTTAQRVIDDLVGPQPRRVFKL
ncbi:glucuronate isomerase [Pseudoclavibacter sp. VKM Ac-2867]|uniref:glucuronate isomerase n=1 Tax=Pseudoclavibacter sp. VKM Ac-2867 TaxID=2783829 RepID=UPI00188A4EE6|nr:glucuronate isomerase [Pseudoclavibacter sp. VKM Ac-2867]MBF4460107.1 glucuronate isomerase [Pseudoclavibacter sp. VKM Ac-2867]